MKHSIQFMTVECNIPIFLGISSYSKVFLLGKRNNKKNKMFEFYLNGFSFINVTMHGFQKISFQ